MSVVETFDSKVALLAAQGLFNPTALTLDEMRAVCAAALSHVPIHRQKEILQERPLHGQIDIALATFRLDEEQHKEAAMAEAA
jgi:demethoxyubiquinone hydroxylase (CLK1/Coq7/Cat5 family)